MNEPQALIALQRLDLDIIQLKTQLDELPERSKIVNGRRKMADVGTLLERGRGTVAGIDRVIKGLEDDTAMVSEKLDKEQARLMSGEITDPREMQYVAREMDSLRRQRDKAEFTMLEQLEKREAAESQVAKIDEALTSLKTNDETYVASYRASGGALKAEIERLAVQRETVAALLSPALREKYEHLAASRHGVAVGILEGDTCTACRVTLPGNAVRALTAGGPIGRCPLCTRILVVDPDHD